MQQCIIYCLRVLAHAKLCQASQRSGLTYGRQVPSKSQETFSIIHYKEVHTPGVMFHELTRNLLRLCAMSTCLYDIFAPPNEILVQHGVSNPWIKKHGSLTEMPHVVMFWNNIEQQLLTSISFISQSGVSNQKLSDEGPECSRLWQKGLHGIVMQDLLSLSVIVNGTKNKLK